MNKLEQRIIRENIRRREKTLAEERFATITLGEGIPIGEHPSAKRIAFPYEIAPPLRKAELHVQDVSTNSDGSCVITPGYSLHTHNHAGAHADRPLHMGVEYRDTEFDDKQYTGEAHVLNIANTLTRKRTSSITPEILTEALRPIQNATIRRLLLKTYNTYPQGWDQDFAHLTREGAAYLAENKNLVLLGIDTPSVDHPNQNIHEGAHMPLLGNGIAVLEGLRLEGETFDKAQTKGAIQTIRSNHQNGTDAWGAHVFYYTITGQKI